MNGGTSSVFRTSMQPFSSFVHASVCCLLLLEVCLRFHHLRSSAFSPFSSGFCHFRNFHTSLSHIYHTSLSPFFLHKLVRFLILSFITLTCWSLWAKCCQFYCLLFYCLLFFKVPLILFVLDECRNFFSVAHFDAAILVFCACFGAAFYCFNCAFCSTTYVHPLSNLSLLGFVTFVIFTLRCHLFFIFCSHRFSS